MLSAQAAIRDHNTAVTAYAECVRKTGGNELKVQEAVAQLEKVAQQFNAELRIFKQKNSAP
jgi:hypothetical protein